MSRRHCLFALPETAALAEDVAAGRLDDSTIYVVHPASLPAFQGTHAACGRVDGRDVCVSSRRNDPFRDRLARGGP